MGQVVGVKEPGCGQVALRYALVGLICLGLAGLGARELGSQRWVSRSLDTRAVGLRERMTSLRARDAGPRKVLRGESQDGNAADDYRQAEALVKDLHVLGFATARQKMARDLPLTVSDLEGLEPLAEVPAFVAAGARKERCDWEHEIEGLVTLTHMEGRMVGNVMSVQAYQEPSADEALDMGFDLLSYGRDLSRGRGLIGAMIGLAVRALGCKVLLACLRRRPLSEEQCLRIVSVLDDYEELADDRHLLDETWFFTEMWLATLAGRPLTPEYEEKIQEHLRLVGIAESDSPPMAQLFHSQDRFDRETRKAIDDFVRRRQEAEIEREWAALARTKERLRALDDGAPGERKAQREALRAELEGEAIVAHALLGEDAVRENLLDLRAIEAGTRVLAAAHVHRLRTGSFPAGVSALEPVLGSAPDPFQPDRPLTLVLQGGILRAYSWGRDGVDGGGPMPPPGSLRAGGDIVLTTKAPPKAKAGSGQ